MLNKVMLIGNLGRDPELRHTQGGTAVCNLNLATTDKWFDKGSGEKQERTEWHRVVVWGKQAENCDRYLEKGRRVFVEGSLQTREWEQDGVKRYTTEIKAHSVQFLGGGAGGGDSRGGKHNAAPSTWGATGGGAPAKVSDADIPF